MYNRFNDFCIILLNVEKYLKIIDTRNFDPINYAEVKFAYDTKSLYWRPNYFKKEFINFKGVRLETEKTLIFFIKELFFDMQFKLCTEEKESFDEEVFLDEELAEDFLVNVVTVLQKALMC